MEIKDLKTHSVEQMRKLPKESRMYEEHLLTLSIIDTNKKYFDEIDKLSKVIDLMAEYIDSNNYVDNEECQFQWDFDIKKCIENGDCKDCIKQYFERKSKEC